MNTGTGTTELALADLAAALGAADVPGWSAAEQALTAAAAAARGQAGGPSGETVSAVRSAIQQGADPLGEELCRLRTPAQRRPTGQTLTPWPVVDSMIRWADGVISPARVVDPGTCSARFLVAAGRRWPGAELTGVETDPLAAMTGRASLAAAGMAARSAITLSDYRSLRLPPAGGPTLFIGNPPYVRHHQIAAPWKDWLRGTAARLGLPASGLAGLHAHFFLATAMCARAGDAGAFVTAAEWLDVNYGSLVRALLLDVLGGDAIHLLDPAVAAFPGTATTAAITCFRPGTRPRHLRLRQVASVAGLGALTGGTAVPVPVLRAASRWRSLSVPARTVPARARVRPPAGQVELGELCQVHRGQVTGANKVWITRAGQATVPPRFAFPAVTRATELLRAGGVLATATGLREVIDLPADLGGLPEPERAMVESFLARARAAGAADSYIARHRRPWWRVRLPEPAPILATYMARRPPAFVRNLAGARHVNIAHGLYPRMPLPAAALDGLAAFLSRSVSEAQGRTYAGGLTKFEPKEMERLPVPEPCLLPGFARPAASATSDPAVIPHPA
jgi:adenine-specific DNA-methyltransferase